MPTLTVKTELFRATNRSRQLVTQVQVGVNVGTILRQEGILAPGEIFEHAKAFSYIHLMTTQLVQLEFNYVDPYDTPHGLWQTQCHRVLSGSISARALRITGLTSQTKFDLVLATQPLESE